MKVFLLEFLRTGYFGTLNIGSFRSEVEATLGPPPNWSAKSRHENAAIWKYGDVEFHFAENKVRSVFSDHGELADGGSSLEIDPWIIRRGITCKFLGEQLQHEHIDFNVSPHGQNQCVLFTSSGISFCFSQADSQPDAEFILESWSLQGK